MITTLFHGLILCVISGLLLLNLLLDRINILLDSGKVSLLEFLVLVQKSSFSDVFEYEPRHSLQRKSFIILISVDFIGLLVVHHYKNIA